MAAKYPYVSSPGPLAKTFEQLRRSFPQVVNAGTLKKLGLAPNNESYIINTLRFISVIDEESQGTDDARKAFSQHDDAAFAKALDPLLRKAYASLFDLHGDSSWTLGRDDLITFFRNDDGSTAIVGERQATTFATLASFAGHGQKAEARAATPRSKAAASTPAPRSRSNGAKVAIASPARNGLQSTGGNDRVGLSVRVEINLPATNDQDVYDKIFRSLRANLLDAPTS